MNSLLKPGFMLGACYVVLAGTACSQGPSAPKAEPSSVSEGSVEQKVPEARPSTDFGAMWTQQVSEAVEDLAQREGIPADTIKVREARSVDWGSSAVGCPEEGVSYTEAMVPGLWVLLEVDGVVYYYHGKNGESLFYCPTERARAPAYGPGEEIM